MDKAFSGTLNQLPYKKHIGVGNREIPGVWDSVLGPADCIGQFVGACLAGWLSDFLGRRNAMAVGVLLSNLSTALIIWSPNLPVILLSRILSGISTVVLLTGFQLYAAEVTSEKERGSLSNYLEITGEVFSLLGGLIAWATTYTSADWAWRTSLGVIAGPLTILAAALPFIPESRKSLRAFMGASSFSADQIQHRL